MLWYCVSLTHSGNQIHAREALCKVSCKTSAVGVGRPTQVIHAQIVCMLTAADGNKSRILRV